MSTKSKKELFVEAKENWLKDCEVCNTGLCATIDNLQQKTGYKLNTIYRMMAEESDGLYTWDQLKQRYRYHKGKTGNGRNSPKDPMENDRRSDFYNSLMLLEPPERELHTKIYYLTRRLVKTADEIRHFNHWMGMKKLDSEEFNEFFYSIDALSAELAGLLYPFGLVWVGEVKKIDELEAKDLLSDDENTEASATNHRRRSVPSQEPIVRKRRSKEIAELTTT